MFVLLVLAGIAAVAAGCELTRVGTKGGVPTPRVIRAEFDQVSYVPRAALLALLANPSARATALEVKHMKQLIRALGRPNLQLVGIWEQATNDDGLPWNGSFISTKSPMPASLPPLPPSLPSCSSGSDFQQALCRRHQTAVYNDARTALLDWRSSLDQRVTDWKARTIAALDGLVDQNEEAPANRWDLHGALVRLGQVLQGSDINRRCAVLVGGLLTRRPPQRLPVGLFAGSTVIVPSWAGSETLKKAWQNAFATANAKVVFIPRPLTELRLTDQVASCLNGTR